MELVSLLIFVFAVGFFLGNLLRSISEKKKLPTWKKYGNPVSTTFLLENSEKLFRNGYVIDLTDLERLPKEE